MKQQILILIVVLLLPSMARAEAPVPLIHSRSDQVVLWQRRIQMFLDKGVIPIVDMESSLTHEDNQRYQDDALRAMDAAGVALMVLDGYQAEKDGSRGYRWGYTIHALVNAHPDRFALATNGGTNNNWVTQKSGKQNHFIDQTSTHARSGDYAMMGEFEFRHYMSSSQCLSGQSHRDVTVPMTSPNGHAVFALSQETGLPFLAHVEFEDQQIDDLETMLTQYPGATIIVCHFGQIRHPEQQTRFSPTLIRRLLTQYDNLYFDLSTGHPGRKYPCSGVLDTALWLPNAQGQRDRLKPEYRDLLTDFSHRFVSGFDYGGSRGNWGAYIQKRAANIRRIIKDLPNEAQHNIAYRNAWHLLTTTPWPQEILLTCSPSYDQNRLKLTSCCQFDRVLS